MLKFPYGYGGYGGYGGLLIIEEEECKDCGKTLKSCERKRCKKCKKKIEERKRKADFDYYSEPKRPRPDDRLVPFAPGTSQDWHSLPHKFNLIRTPTIRTPAPATPPAPAIHPAGPPPRLTLTPCKYAVPIDIAQSHSHRRLTRPIISSSHTYTHQPPVRSRSPLAAA